MTIKEALVRAYALLKKTRIDSPILDADLLLAYSLGIAKEKLIIHPEIKISAARLRRFFSLIGRRAAREPVAYLVGHKEFYGLDFLVNKSTLIPRPETETLIELVLEKVKNNLSSSGGDSRFRGNDIMIVDVGTGSGAIAVTLAKQLPQATVYATDISTTALTIAQKNAKKNKVAVIFKKGNLLEPVIKPIANSPWPIVIVANLPYVHTHEWKTLQSEITKFEPRSAVDGGRDGLKYYRELLKQLKVILSGSEGSLKNDQVVKLFFEFDPEETTTLKRLVKKYFPLAKIEIKKDLAKRNRVLVAEIK